MTRDRFNDEEVEAIEAFITIFAKILDIERPTWTRSRVSIDRAASEKVTRGDAGSSSGLFTMFWLDEKYLLKFPWIERYDTVVHEMLHIKFPKLSETKIQLLAYHYTNIVPEHKNRHVR